MNAKEIFQKLAERAMFSVGLCSSLRRRPGKPGEMIEKLSPEEREELQNLTSKDTQETPRSLMYIQGQYGDSTVTVHKLFPNKKEEENE